MRVQLSSTFGTVVSLEDLVALKKAAGRPVAFIGYVCGTDQDPQNRSKVVAGLKSAGVLVASSNAEAATWSAALITERQRTKS